MWNKLIGSVALAIVAGSSMAACVVEQDDGNSAVSVEQDIKAKIFCGGFANLPCPTGMTCADDPTDDCNPNKGGADCGGVCRPAPKAKCEHQPSEYVALGDQCQLVKFACVPGSVPFFDSCGCGCTAGIACGGNSCGSGEYCCNSSCGICAPTGGVCTQQVCAPVQ